MSNCGPTCGPLCRSDTLVKWLAHYGNVPVCWAGPHYGTARPLATHIREDEDGFTAACEAHRRLTVLKEHPMTNEDQLRVIRERLAAITPRHITANPMQWQQDGNYLLQLVTEQQRGLELVSEVFDWFYPSGPRERVGDESTVCAVCFNEQCATDCAWRQAAEYFTPPEPTAGNEAKGYRKQERPI